MAQVFWFLPLRWDAQMEFLARGFLLTESWLLKLFEEGVGLFSHFSFSVILYFR